MHFAVVGCELCQHLGLCVRLFGPLQAPVQLMGGGLAWLHTRLAGRAVTSVSLVGAVARFRLPGGA